MFTQTQKPNHHFNTYHQDNRLLIQFIMIEFVQTYHLVHQIKTIIKECLKTSPLSPQTTPALFQALGHLLGCSSPRTRLPYSRWTGGPLTRLKDYCDQFSCNTGHKDKDCVGLHLTVHQAWLMALHNLELLGALQTTDENFSDQYSVWLFPIKQAFNRLQMRLNQVQRYLPRVLNNYLEDENVLFCLLRHKEALMQIYGTEFLEKLFKSSSHSRKLFKSLIQRYRVRGFNTLLPKIQQLLINEGVSCELS